MNETHTATQMDDGKEIASSQPSPDVYGRVRRRHDDVWVRKGRNESRFVCLATVWMGENRPERWRRGCKCWWTWNSIFQGDSMRVFFPFSSLWKKFSTFFRPKAFEMAKQIVFKRFSGLGCWILIPWKCQGVKRTALESLKASWQQRRPKKGFRTPENAR